MLRFPGKPITATLAALSLLLALVVACGGAAPTEQPATTGQSQPAAQQPAGQQAAPQQPAAQQPSGQQPAAPRAQATPKPGDPTRVPIATAAPTPETAMPEVVEKPEGRSTSGRKSWAPSWATPV